MWVDEAEERVEDGIFFVLECRKIKERKGWNCDGWGGGGLLCSGLRSADRVEMVPLTTMGCLDLWPGCQCWLTAVGLGGWALQVCLRAVKRQGNRETAEEQRSSIQMNFLWINTPENRERRMWVFAVKRLNSMRKWKHESGLLKVCIWSCCNGL